LETLAEPVAGAALEVIRIRGARMHNLQNVDLDIPRERLVVITGPSGSGKSSLAFDTLYAEGQRQYIESLSVYARQFLHQMQRPEVDSIEGLQPTLCIDQRPGSVNPRSTVATATEIYDYLRLLMARLGEASCPQRGECLFDLRFGLLPNGLAALPKGTRLLILAPLVRGRRGKQEDALARIRKAGFVRVRIDGEVFDLDNAPELDAHREHFIDAVVDRIIVRPDMTSRLGESVRLAVRHGEGLLVACYQDPPPGETDLRDGPWRDRLFSTRYACPNCNISMAEIEPRTFSFNSPYGACPRCGGLGGVEQFDPELVLPNVDLTWAGGAIAAWKGVKPDPLKKHKERLVGVLEKHGAGWNTPLKDLSAEALQELLHGDGQGFAGILNLIEQEYVTATDEDRRSELARFRGRVTCPACLGSRLRPEANGVRVGGRTLHEICLLPIAAAARFFERLEFSPAQRPIAEPLLKEILPRLAFLQNVGVDYLTLHRAADTLSGGELQRVRLATSIGSGLVGVCYVLDEPSIGLHPRDNRRLIDALRNLQQQGNSVLVVEHDEAIMRAADQLIDIGPGAGPHGGRIVAQGTLDEICGNPDSITGRYLSGQQQIPVPETRRRLSKSRSLVLEGVATNNLHEVDVRFPLEALICVTGVSGSGKSSLINETLAPVLIRRLGGVAPRPGPFRSLRGAALIDKVIQIDQAPIGRTPRSSPATYIGALDEIRKVFARTREAKQRGFGVGRFSYNVKGGRCEPCQGLGLKKIEMQFLPDLYVTCSECQGARFNRQTLEVRYRDQSIADVLAMPVDRAVSFFENFPVIHRGLTSFQDVGLGYLTLGQPSTTLSGGEAQRIKLAAELSRVDTGHTLYLLDEPTTGLHFDDIRRLLDVLGRLVDRGNTVIVIEHSLEVVKCADWVIDLGPEGGEAGGHVLAAGTPEDIAALEDNHTGRFLRPLLAPPHCETHDEASG
jgi:excinuclease ABC subunit A